MSGLLKKLFKKIGGALKKRKDKKKEDRFSTYHEIPKDLRNSIKVEEFNEMVDSDWCYQKYGGESFFGPYDWVEFKKLYRQGKIGMQTEVLGGDLDDFKRLQNCPDLLALLKSSDQKKGGKKKK